MKITKTFKIEDPVRGSAPVYVTMSLDVGVSWAAQSAATGRLQEIAEKIQAALKSGEA